MGLKTTALRSLNAFPRAEEHLMQKTASGAAVTILGLILMVTLFIHELSYQLSTTVVHEMSVDLTRGQKLPIVINMTFPALPCGALSLDSIDMSGKHEVDIDTNIWKIRINKDGYILGSEYISDLVEGEHTSDIAKEEAAAKKAMEDAGHFHQDSFTGESHEQYHEHKLFGDPQKVVKDIKKALEDHEGCRVFGVLDVERVAGNFHVSMHGLSIYVAQQVFPKISDVNVSHVIHDLSFGPRYPGLHNPLDGTERILKDESGTFKYFLKIVPTEYSYLSGGQLPTNQFSVTEYFMSAKAYEQNWPAVYFVYDLSPIAVKVREERRHLGHFFTRICAVLGGTFAVTGMLDRWVYRLIEMIEHANKGKSIML
ncbi:hypothetical protein R1sor_019980 [Riccia sorocarpa]|uniref:Endoplasmic reticulum-Golgi intermediate compartment protein 3 n=1 Tax=Riccia sorocarpa TaxID=122646 RepID=A0ABD3IE54_9MARC